ncbi:jeltraxin-like isoform X1 [Styela clava]
MTSEAPVNTTQASTVSESHQCFRVIYYFPNKNQITDFVKINKTMPTLTEATICAWVTPLPSSTVSGALFSYFTEHSYLGNTLLLFFPKNQNELQVHVNYRYAELAPSFLWTSRKRSHICVVVSTITDNVKMYVNGSIYGQQNFSFAKSNLPGNGTAIIGQEQDDNGGAFDKKQSFSGTVENFLMWNRILDDSEINKIHAAECDCVSNFILSPTRDLFEIHGNVNATYKDC